ncbi:MAG: TrmB family transcriptional regulator [Alphaproteobacteria bacterium]|nr:TrmB family transcriptional regulator [Alphaproteobacteria bacterium]
MDTEGIVAQLAQLGLTRNQSLAWIALLRDDSDAGLTGYEVGSRSGVPRSAIYKVLQQLEEVGAVFAVGSEPQRFHAAEPQGWLTRERQRSLDRFSQLEHALRDLPKPNRPEPIWIVRRYDDVLARIDAMIRGAEASIYLHLWPREVERLWPAFEATAGRDLHRVLYSPAPTGRVPPGFSCWTGALDGDGKAAWSHKALVVIDRREALIGGTELDADNDAVWTQNASLVDVATNHIILDITLLSRASGRDAFDDVAPMMRPHLSR